MSGPGTLGKWLTGKRTPTAALPARPPLGPTTAIQPPKRAVCCSGGGIRAAAFALGGMQGLQRPVNGRSWYDDVNLVTAVSGGSYLAGSMAMVNHRQVVQRQDAATRELRGEETENPSGTTEVPKSKVLTRDPGELPPYAIGSPEDQRLRNHTRYLVDDGRLVALGVVSIVYGLLLNLLPILAGVYLLAKLLGLALFKTEILTHTGREWTVDLTLPVAVVGALAGLGLLLFVLDRLHNVYRRYNETLSAVLQTWAIRTLGLAAAAAFGLVVVPELLRLLSTGTGLNGIDPTSQGAAFLTTVTGLVGLVKATLLRFRSKLQTSTDGAPTVVESWTGRILKAVAPWAGSLLVVALLLAALLVWTASAAYDGLQRREVVWMIVAVAGSVAWQALTDINRNSIHPFYKQRLSSAFAVHRTDNGSSAEEIPYQVTNRLSDLALEQPELVICASVNTDQQGVVPSGRGCAPFTFSPQFTGISSGTMFDGENAAAQARTPSDPTLLRPTDVYEKISGPRLLTVPAAMAVSGAAVSPTMGRMTRKPMRLLLGIANVRLGLWLPNPRYPGNWNDESDQRPSFRRTVARQFRQPGIPCLLREILGSITLDGRWIYVTDGGHYENLGLIEALRRGATEIVVFDASGDPPSSWQAFGEAVETARTDLGVEIDLDPTPMRPTPGSTRAPVLAVRGTCHYPDGQTATLYLCKLALPETAEASWDVFAWAGAHEIFPHDPTTDQLYGDREFEAYRRLGEIAAGMALTKMHARPERRRPMAAIPPARVIPPLGYLSPKRRGATTHKSTVSGQGPNAVRRT